MNCKNCAHPIEDDDLFCENCGAKVIHQRITLRLLINEVLAAFGLNNLYVLTLKKMVLTPDEVLKEYLNGVRKRYLAPFTYLAIGAGFSFLIFNFFKTDFKRMQSYGMEAQAEAYREAANKDLSKIPNLSEIEYKRLEKEKKTAQRQLKMQEDFGETYLGFMLRNFNWVTFLFIPLYAIVSFLVYRKPHNFGEHIIMNAYIQGTTSVFTLFAFILSLVTHPLVYMIGGLAMIPYYIYVFKKLYHQSIKQVVLKFLKFVLIIVLAFIILMVIAGLVGFLLVKFKVIDL